MKKFLSVLSVALCFALCFATFAACGKGEDAGKNTTTTTILEAEYTNLDGITGGGLSGSADGVEMIMGNGAIDESKYSAGYYVAYTYVVDFTLTFNFNADKAETGKITLRLGSEMGDLVLDSTIFVVEVNGDSLDYSGMQVKTEFKDKPINTSFNIKEGANTIKLIVKSNTLNGGQQGGPLIDCIKITSKAKLSWTPLTDNPSRRGEI